MPLVGEHVTDTVDDSGSASIASSTPFIGTSSYRVAGHQAADLGRRRAARPVATEQPAQQEHRMSPFLHVSQANVSGNSALRRSMNSISSASIASSMGGGS